jgi:probable phosphoglycerate mutase
MTVTRTLLHLIRHGDAIPLDDAAISTAGYEDLPLSEKGTAQAFALAQRLKGGPSRPDALYASPTLRAKQTAETIGTAVNLSVTTDDRLREIFLGIEPAAGMPPLERAAAVRARLAELAAIAIRDGSWAAVPGCEPGAAVRARMRDAIDEIVARHPGGSIALVSHAGSINAYLAEILGLQRDFSFPVGNTSLSTLRYADHPPMVVRVNDTAHLEVHTRV